MHYISTHNVSADPTVKRYGYFGRGLDIPVWSYMRCYGWEDSVDECPKDVYPSINCYNWGYGIAGVKCRDSEWYKRYYMV